MEATRKHLDHALGRQFGRDDAHAQTSDDVRGAKFRGAGTWTLIVLALGAGCREARAQSFDDLLPLELGNRWDYRKSVEYPGQLPQVTRTFSRVRGVYLFNREKWYHYEEDGVCFWVNNREGGQYEGEIGVDEETLGLKVDRDFQIFRWPVKKGERWDYHVDLTSDADPTEVHCISTDELVVVPAGRFHCVVYEMVDDYVVSSFFFSKGVGLVRAEWHDKETRETSQIELVRFTPASKDAAKSTNAATPPQQ